MPSKARRAASRQARLSRKKRRGKGGSQEFIPGPTQSSSTTETAVQEPVVEGEDEELQGPEAATQPARSAPSTRSQARAPRRTRQQRLADAASPTIYKYIGAELRQIGIITSVIVVLIVALTFVLR